MVALAVTVKSEVLEPMAGTVTMVGLSETVRPGSEATAVKLTVPLKPPRLNAVTMDEFVVV